MIVFSSFFFFSVLLKERVQKISLHIQDTCSLELVGSSVLVLMDSYARPPVEMQLSNSKRLHGNKGEVWLLWPVAKAAL